MRKSLRNAVLLSLFAGLLVLGIASLFGTNDSAAAKPGGGGTKCTGCPRPCVACIDVYDPVICSDGQVYSNSCYAYVACATGCVPYGDGGPIEVQ